MSDTIRIMVYRHSAFYCPLLATVAAGYLKDEELEATYFVKPKERNLYEMFQRGEVEIMQAAVSTSWDPLSKGIKDIPRHFAQINQHDGFFIAGRGNAPFRWADMEGAKLIADRSQQPLAMLKYALHLQGVNWDRIEKIQAGTPEEMAYAFRRGIGDYVHLQGPAPQQLENDGIAHIVACVGEALPPVAFSSLMAMPEFLASENATAFMRAYRRALEWVNAASAADIAECILPMFPGMSLKPLTAAVSRYQSLGTWRRDPAIPREQYETAMDAFLFVKLFDRRFPYEDVVAAPPQ